jgi:hypothetical protein
MLIQAAILVGCGYVVGRLSGGSDPLPAADANAYWDAARGAYVTGTCHELCFWKVVDGRVTEATFYRHEFPTVVTAAGGTANDWDRAVIVSATVKPDATRAPGSPSPVPAGR